MISSTLLANGATVYIIGPKQEDLDKWVSHMNAIVHAYSLTLDLPYHRVAKKYSDACEKTGKPGRMYGIEGDIRKKVSHCRCVYSNADAECRIASRRRFVSQTRLGSASSTSPSCSTTQGE